MICHVCPAQSASSISRSGSHFCNLPYKTSRRVDGPACGGGARSARRREMQYKALIVDDSKLARMVMASAFRRLGPEWELIEASNADDAISAIAAQAVDIALVDCPSCRPVQLAPSALGPS